MPDTTAGASERTGFIDAPLMKMPTKWIAMSVNGRMENIGARRLHTVMTTLLEDVLYELPDRGTGAITVDGQVVNDRLRAVMEDEDLRRYIL